MHAITKYIAAAYALGIASGVTLRELLSFVGRKYRMWRDHRIDNRVVSFLLHERICCLLPAPDKYGQQPAPYYRSSRQIADALNLTSVDILQRLERMEGKRVQRLGTKADQWTVTQNELHDDAHRRKRTRRWPFLVEVKKRLHLG